MAATWSASDPRRRWRDRITPPAPPDPVTSNDLCRTRRFDSDASLDMAGDPDAAPRFARFVVSSAEAAGGARVNAAFTQSRQARAHGRHPPHVASAARARNSRRAAASASSFASSSSFSSRKGTSSETALKSAVPMTSSCVVRCSWYTAMHWRRMCLRALRTATCTLTSGRVRPSFCSRKPVVVPFTASVSTTTTPVHSSAMGPTFSSAYASSPSLTASANAKPTAPLNPPHQHTAASAKVSP